MREVVSTGEFGTVDSGEEIGEASGLSGRPVLGHVWSLMGWQAGEGELTAHRLGLVYFALAVVSKAGSVIALGQISWAGSPVSAAFNVCGRLRPQPPHQWAPDRKRWAVAPSQPQNTRIEELG